MARDPDKPRQSRPKTRSTTGNGNPTVDMTNWRVQLQRRRLKFDDVQKAKFLKALATHGMKGRAAEAADICLSIANNHREVDPEFAAAYEAAYEKYRDRVHKVVQKIAIRGLRKPIVGGEFRDQVVAYETIYATNILAMEMKRVDHAWREKTEITANVRGGVLVAPAEVADVTEWAALYGAKADEKVGDGNADSKAG